jgi:hypothetical protein
MRPAMGSDKMALLGPVPCAHIAGALEAGQTHGRVAFGTMLKELFVDSTSDAPLVPQGLRVLIYVSKTGIEQPFAAQFFAGPCATFEGTFLRWRNADQKTGRHPDPSVRPISTEPDSAWMGFYEVADLCPCTVPLTSFRWVGSGRRVESAPRRPGLVRDIAG